MLNWGLWVNDRDEHGWSAYSAIHDDGTPFEWIIVVNIAGLFSVENSASELTDRKEPFETLAAAKAWCQTGEDIAITEAELAAFFDKHVSKTFCPIVLGGLPGTVKNTGNKYWDGQAVHILECPYPNKCRVRSKASGDITWVDADYLVTPSF